MNRPSLVFCVLLLATGLGCLPPNTCVSDNCPPGQSCRDIKGVGTYCAPTPCSPEDPSVCTGGTFCWAPAGGDGESVCTEVRPCDGGSLFDEPFCSEGTCESDGLVCGLTAGVGDDGQQIVRRCGCVPPPEATDP